MIVTIPRRSEIGDRFWRPLRAPLRLPFRDPLRVRVEEAVYRPSCMVLDAEFRVIRV